MGFSHRFGSNDRYVQAGCDARVCSTKGSDVVYVTFFVNDLCAGTRSSQRRLEFEFASESAEVAFDRVRLKIRAP
jgi:hypothetical protein